MARRPEPEPILSREQLAEVQAPPVPVSTGGIEGICGCRKLVESLGRDMSVYDPLTSFLAGQTGNAVSLSFRHI
jgi:hypothetical protein